MEQVDFNAPTGWSWKKFKDVCVLKRGYDLPTHARSAGDFPLYSANGVTDYIDQYKVDGPGVVTGRSGTIGKVHFVEGDYWPLNTALYVQKFNGNHPRFIKYFLENFDLTRFASGAAVPTLNRNSLSAELVCVPDSVDEQKRIVEKLDALLTRIDTAIEHLQESVTLADLLYASELNEIFNPRSLPINQNGIYELPHGWEWQELADVVVKTENLNPLKHADQIWTYIDISSVDRDRFAIKDPKEILGKDAPSRAKKHVQLNDVIFATTRPNLKNIALIRDEYSSPVASTGFCVLRANEKVLPAYLFYFVTTDFVQAQIEPYVGGASYPAITDGNLKKALIPIPGCEEQKRIVEKINSIGKLHVGLKEQLQFKITSLRQLKASILDSAFKGEL